MTRLQKNISWLAFLCLGFNPVFSPAFAQNGGVTTVAAKLPAVQQAAALLAQGLPQQAQAVLTNVPSTSPDYALGKDYAALSQYALGDKRGFLKAAESGSADKSLLPADLQESFDFDQIASLFFYRRFDKLLTQTLAFSANHAGSPRSQSVTEYELAALYERGMKKLVEASILTDTNQANARGTTGCNDLVIYLTLASDFKTNCYQVLTNRSLKEEVWKAQMALGNEQSVVQALSQPNTNEVEKLAWLSMTAMFSTARMIC